MTTLVINSESSLHAALGTLRELYGKHKYVKLTAKSGKARSIDQNSISHTWYEQLSIELRDDDALGWKCFCKLNIGVPILRSEDEGFRNFYDASIKNALTYEEKLDAMKYLPITSLMTKPQFSKYLEAMQKEFAKQGVRLEFPNVE